MYECAIRFLTALLEYLDFLTDAVFKLMGNVSMIFDSYCFQQLYWHDCCISCVCVYVCPQPPNNSLSISIVCTPLDRFGE